MSFFFRNGRRGSNSLPGIPRMAVAIRRNPASPLDLTRSAQVEAAGSPALRCISKKTPPGVVFLLIVHRFCCLHSRPPQGRGIVRGEPLTGSPTRVQSPARRRPLLRSKSAAPKKKDTHMGVFLFCDCPQVLLSVNQCLLSCFSGDVVAPSSKSVTT